MTSFGAPAGRIGTSEAGKRIHAAGRDFAEEQRRIEFEGREAAVAAALAGAEVIEAAGVRAGHCYRIIQEVAEKHGINIRDLLSHRRSRWLIPGRHEAMFRCVAETSLSLPAIARVFHRDHTSIGHAVMRHHSTTGAPLPRGMDWKAGR